MELQEVKIGIYHLKMHLKVVRYQMSHYQLCSKSKPIMKKSYFEYFIVDYFPTLNKKDPVYLYINIMDHTVGRVTCIPAQYLEDLCGTQTNPL